jgi:hypothetical protein
MPYERHPCEFYLLRYVPDPVRDEFVHVGVILRENGRASGTAAGAGTPVRTAVRFTSDWRRVRCLDPEADTGMLEGLESELRRRFAEEPAESLMRVLEDSFSNCVQVTRAKAYLAESVDAGVEELMRLYVEPLKRERGAARATGRAAIVGAMRTEFERAGVWDLMRKRIAAAQYTRAGDPLRIDLGYRPNGVIRMFQAVSLDAGAASGQGLEAAKALAFSAAALSAGVERVEKAGLELTAVVEPVRQLQGPGIRDQGAGTRSRSGRKESIDSGGEENSEWFASYRFAVETMEEQRIRVLTTADLGRAAETARREMGI